MNGGDGEGGEGPVIDASTVAGCLCGLTQLEIFVDAYYSIRLGKKNFGFVMTRLFEGMVESETGVPSLQSAQEDLQITFHSISQGCSCAEDALDC